MKKIYLSPVSESIILNSVWAICTGSDDPSNSNVTGGGGGSSGRDPMPRKPF